MAFIFIQSPAYGNLASVTRYSMKHLLPYCVNIVQLKMGVRLNDNSDAKESSHIMGISHTKPCIEAAEVCT